MEKRKRRGEGRKGGKEEGKKGRDSCGYAVILV